MASSVSAVTSPKVVGASTVGAGAALSSLVQEDGAVGSPDRDSRGVKRGKCVKCSNCTGYVVGKTSNKCTKCQCPPGRHRKAGTNGEATGSVQRVQSAVATPVNTGAHGNSDGYSSSPKCLHCSSEAYFDPNKRWQYLCCRAHLPDDLDDLDSLDDDVSGINLAPHISGAPASNTVKDPSLCAIEDCDRPRHKDESGQVHECCSFSHAIELSRRRALERK